MKNKTFYYVATFIIFLVALSSVAAASSCSGTCKNVKISNVYASPSTGTAPLKVGFHSTIEGNFTKVTYEIISQKTGKVLAACSSYCTKCVKDGKCNCAATFYTPGSYDVRATAYGKDGCCVNTSIKNAVTVKAANCTPDFTYVVKGKSVYFKPVATGAKAYYWNFGDGKISRGINPAHYYKKAGTYKPCLSIKCSNGKWISICKAVTVK